MDADTLKATLGRGGVRLVAVACFCAVYLFCWQPVRTVLLRDVAYPALQQAAAGTAYVAAYQPGPQTVGFRSVQPDTPAPPTLPRPSGVRMLLPALLLVALRPTRLVWLGFAGGHLALYTAWTAALTFGLAVAPVGFSAARLIGQYLIDAYSLGVPALVVATQQGALRTAEEAS
jgi:hypothetical protein